MAWLMDYVASLWEDRKTAVCLTTTVVGGCAVLLLIHALRKRNKNVDFRGVLKRQVETNSTTESNQAKAEDAPDFREALSRPVRTKVLTEEERKLQRAEQKDFRGKLVRKVDTKTVTNEALKVKSPSQKDFRDEALKTKVKTKAYAEEVIKQKHAEQVDFRAEALKTKVTPKAYREENIKAMRAEQVDFREVLSPTAKRLPSKEEMSPTSETPKFELSGTPAKMKLNKDKMEHNTVATRRARARGGVAEPVRRTKASEEEVPKGKAPEFNKEIEDKKVNDASPFELVCHVTGHPPPKVSWFLGDEEIHSEADISITQEGGVCKLAVTESFPDDEGTYLCRAENEHGVAQCSAHVTVVTDEPPEPIDERPKFVKKQTSLPESLSPARIEEGPDDLTILRGNPISLCCKLSGSPPLKTAWRKGKHEISHSSQCNIDITNHSASLTIVKSEKDDSGCYTLQVKNAAGVDQYSVNVSVVDVPDPPGQPFASDISASSLVLSWYGSGYDGGSLIKSYQMEMAEIDTKGKLTSQWSVIASTNSTSYTLKNLKPNTRRVFRISAENRYGVSKPGPQSDVVINTETEVVESSDEEDAENFVKHDAVLMRTDGSFSEKYEIKEKLGQGRFGKVHRVISRNTGKSYAAKIMRALKAKDKEAVQQEIDVMNSLRHPRLVQLIDAYTHGREITMVMDLVAGGELFERVIDEDFELTEAACIKYMRQICDGLKYMHDNMILHLDLKPENIMCINKTGTKIKIIDFGLARRYSHSETIRVMFGTPEFVAPEVINYDAIGPQTDMWSVGVICYILLSGLSPFMGDNDSETLSNITAVEWDFDDDSFDQISDEAKHFIRQLLVKPLGKRYTVSRALEHRWLKKDTEKMSKSKLNTKNLKRFLARRKWQKTGNAVRALGRLASLANLGSSNSNKTPNGQQRESGFLAALKAQLLRDNEEEQLMQENCKPMFEQLFDDIEVIEGSAAKFECVIIGTPDPEIMWFKDGEPIKESRHYKISYTEDDICSLLITDATEADEAEYSCKAVNCEGEVEHRAELIVITPDKISSSDSLYDSSISRSSSFSSDSSFSSTKLIKTPSSSVSFWAFSGQAVAFIFESFLSEKDTPVSQSENASVFQWIRCESKNQDLGKETLVLNSGNRLLIQNDMEGDNPTALENLEVEESSTYTGGYKATSVMILQNVMDSDAGYYLCQEKRGSNQLSIEFHLHIANETFIHKKTKSLSPRFVKCCAEQSVPELVNAELQCTVLGNPTPIIEWYQHGTRIFISDRYKFSDEGSNATLTIIGTHWYDSGKYECRAINTVGEASCFIELYVEPPEQQSVEFDGSPMFLSRIKPVDARIGKLVSFTCMVAGVPTPKIHWKMDGYPLTVQNHPRCRITSGQGGRHELTIRHVLASDKGKYVCVAENEKGTAYCSSFLRIKGEKLSLPTLHSPMDMSLLSSQSTYNDTYSCLPSPNADDKTEAPMFVTQPHRSIVRSGGVAVFRCTVHGTPNPKVYWFHNGIKMKNDSRYRIDDIFGHHCLHIRTTRLSDQGTYICTASNPFGEVSCSAQLEVKMRERSIPPCIQFKSNANQSEETPTTACLSSLTPLSIDKPPKKVWVHSGKTVKLSLTVKGTPKPEVTWNKQGKRIQNGNRYTVSSNGETYMLKISRVNKTDEGYYSVVAYNSAGLTITNLIIHVKEKPVVPVFKQVPSASVTVHKNADATLRCVLKDEVIDSHAKWLKNETLISDEESKKYEMREDGLVRELTIKNVASTDSGSYVCKVKEQTASAELRVVGDSENVEKDESNLNEDGNRKSRELTEDSMAAGATEMMRKTPTGKNTLCDKNLADDEIEKIVTNPSLTQAKITTTSLPTHMKVPEHGSVVIQHSVDQPNVACTWKLNGVQLENERDCKIMAQGCKHTLELLAADPSIAGEVLFQINGQDDVRKTILEIEALPPPPHSATATRVETDKVKIAWQASPVETCDITSYIIEKLDDYSETWSKVAEVTSHVDSFTVGKLLAEKVYSFRVRSKNNAGMSTACAKAEKLLGPQLAVVHGLEDKKISEGEVAHFTVQLNQANVSGDWYLNGLKLISRGESCQIHATANAYSLLLRNLSATGSAKVEFTTSDGKISSSCNLVVEGNPVYVVKELEDVTVIQNSDVTFTVALSRDVGRTGKWYHKGTLLKQSLDIVIGKHAEYHTLMMKNVKGTASGLVQFELPREPKAKSKAELFVKGWYELEPFQKIVKTPTETITLKEGGDAEITVHISNNSKCKPEWLHNGKPVQLKSKRYAVKQKDNVIKLIIKNMTPSDAGKVECIVDKDRCVTQVVVENLNEATITERDLVKENHSIFADVEANDRLVKRNFTEGETNIELDCKVVDSSSEVLWKFNGKTLSEDDESFKIASKNSRCVLQIGCLKSSHNGIFECKSKCNPSDSIKFQVKVKEKLQLFTAKLPSTSKLTEGDDIMLSVKCDQTGSDARWFKDGIMLTIEKKATGSKDSPIPHIELRHSEDSLNHMLIIHNATMADAGKYSCETLHDVTSCKVLIDEPVVTIQEGLKDVEIEEKETASFQIKLSGKVKNKVCWKLNNKILTSSNRCQITSSDNAFSITLRMLSLCDSGIICFQCGDLSQTAKLAVKVPPAVFSKQLSKITTVTEGHEAIFTCEISSENAGVEWRKGDIVLAPSAKYLFVSEGRSRSLSIKNVHCTDSGVYECHTDVDCVQSQLVVQEPKLEILEDLEDADVTEGENASFTLKLSKPNVRVEWLKDGEVLENIEKRRQIASEGFWHALHWRKLELDDSGLISVKVNGETVAEAVLDVKKPPVIFTKELRDLVVDLKTPTEFICEVSNEDSAVTWYRDNVEIDFRSDDIAVLNLQVLSKGTVRKLVIERTYVHHEGKYMCVTESNDRTAGELFVKVPKVEIIRNLDDVKAFKGDDVEFQTEVSCAEVDGEWMIDSERIYMTDKIDIVREHELRILRIRDVNDSIVVSFQAAKNVVTSCRLDVADRPITIVRRLSDMAVRPGGNVVLECEFSKSNLDVTWLYDGKELTTSDKISVSNDGTLHRLELHNVRYDDEGNYTCRYRNRRTSAEIQVREPRVHVIEPLSDLTVMEDETVMLECTLSYPEADVTWLKDNCKILANDSVTVEKGEHFSKHTYVISNSETNDSGNYMISFREKILCSAQVTVRSLPVVVDVPLQDIKVQDDVEYVLLRCKFSRAVRVIWKKDNDIIEDSDKYQIQSFGVEHELTISSISKLDTSFYTCLPVTLCCETTCYVNVEEYLVSVLEPLPENIIFATGTSGVCFCKISLHVNACEVQWLIDDLAISEILEEKYGRITTEIKKNEHILSFSFVTKDLHDKLITFKCRNLSFSGKLEVVSAPSHPRNLTVTPGEDKDVVLTWIASQEDGGRAVELYEVFQCSDDDGGVWQKKTRIHISWSDDTMIYKARLIDLEHDVKYKFSVTAVNCVGSSVPTESSSEFFIQSPLVFINPLADVTVIRGECIELFCQLSRASHDQTMWVHDGITLEENENIMLLEDDVIREMIIEDANLEDTGTYSCTIDGITTKCNVQVKEPLHFETVLSDITSETGTDVAFSCWVSDSFAQCKWMKDGTDIESKQNARFVLQENMHQRSLTIAGCIAEDSGLYECIVCNDREEITTQASLQIHQSEDDSIEDLQECSIESIISQTNSIEEPKYIQTNFSECEIEVVTVTIHSEMCMNKETTDKDITEEVLSENDSNQNLQSMSLEGKSCGEKDNQLLEIKNSIETNIEKTTELEIPASAQPCSTTQTNIESVQDEGLDLVTDHALSTATVEKSSEISQGTVALAAISSEVIQIRDLDTVEEKNVHDGVSDDGRAEAEEEVANGITEGDNSMITEGTGEQTLADITSAEDQVYTPETVVKLMGEMSSDYLKSKEENEFAKSCNISLSKSMDKRISIVSSMTSLEGYDTAVESLQTDEENYQSAVSDVNTICESQTSSSSETEDYHVKVEEMIRPQHLALDFSNTGDDLELATPTPSTTCLTILDHLACQNLQNEVKPTKNQGNAENDLVTQFAVIPADSVVQDDAEDPVPQEYIGTEDEATVRVVYNMPEKSATNVIDMESVSAEHVTESPEMDKEEGNAASTVVTDDIKEMQENSNLNQIATDNESDVTVSSCVTDSNSHLSCDCPKKATEFPSLENSDGLFPSGQEEMKQKAQAQEIPLAITSPANRGSGFEIVVEEKALSEKDKTTIVIDMKTGIATPVSSAKSSSQDLSERRLSSVLRPEIKIMVEPEVQESAKLQAEDLHQADVISNHNEEVIQMSLVNFADIHLPDETAEDKLARLFGLDATTCEYQHDVFQEESILIEENKEENAFYRKDNVQLLNVESAKSNLVLFSMDNKSLPGNLKVSSATKEEMNEKTKGYCSDGVTMLHVGSSKEFHVWREENYENPPLAMKNLQENANCSDSDWDEGCSTPCEVIQETMPDFSLELHDQTAAQGQTVEFCCQVAGIPTPSISWQKEQQGGMYLLSNDMPGVEIRYNDNFRGISVLKIHRVKFEDEGRYSCVAINELGHSSCSAYLKVAEVQQELENEGVKCFTSNEEAKERDVIVVKSAQPRPKPLTIRIKERVIVRESSYTDSGSRSDTSSDATGSSSDGKAEQQKGKIKIRHCRLRQSSPDYLATSSDSFNSDGDDKEWNDAKKFNKPQVYVAVNECDSNENESSSDEKIKLLKNQTVEVLEFESPAEWLVQTKASKTSPSRKGFVDPAFLVPQSSSTVPSVISDTAVKRKRSSVTSMKSSSGQELSRMPSLSKSSDREDAMSESLFTVSSWPDVKSEMSASINTSLMLLAGIPEAPDGVEESSTEWQIVQSLINDEEEYISILRRANHILCNSSDLPPAVEERMQEIFGDLDELYNFHVNILLPELNACFSMPSDLPSVFINLSHHFERLHLAHIVNTHRSQIIINEDSDLLDGVHELTFRVGFEMAEVAQKPTKQLNQYQLHLKKLLRSCHPTAVDSKKIRKAIHVLADIPHQARLTRMWWEVADRPLDTTDFGKLSKEGIFQLLDSSLVPSVRKCKMRHLFLFDNSLVVCKLSRKRGCRKNVHSKYSRIFELHDILLVDSPTFADDRTFTLKSTGETQWHAHLRAHTGDSKRSWCRALGRAIEISNGKISVAPSFVEELQDTTFSAGNDFCLECKVSGSPQPSLLWIKDGVEIATHGDRMQITRRDDDYVGLRIRQSTLNDAGTYRCVAVNTAGQACSEARIVILGTVSFRDLALY